MGKIIVITSGKGGVGKSTVSVGVATALCTGSKRVLLVDGDEGLRCLDMMLNISDRLVFDSSDVINDGINFNESISSVPLIDGLFLLAAPKRRSTVDKKAFASLIVSVSAGFDYVIFDSPAGTDMELNSLLPSSTQFFVVCNTDPVCLRDAEEMSVLLSELGITNSKLIINRFDRHLAKKHGFNVDALMDNTGIMLAGIVPEDSMVQKFLGCGKPLVYGSAAKAFYRISARIDGAYVPLPALKFIQ